MRVLHFLLSVWLVGWLGLAYAAPLTLTLPLYTHYDEPPYAVDDPGNLTSALADFLTRQSGGRYQFVATFLPRKRLDRLAQQGQDWAGVIAWMNPDFFPDPRQRYRWSDVLLADRGLVLSHRRNPVDYQDARSLYGLTLGSVTGRVVNGFEADIAAGRIRREDGPGVLPNLRKLRLQRIDVMFLNERSLPYYRQQISDLDQWLYIAAKPRITTYRHLLVSRGNTALLQFLNRALRQLASDATWQAALHGKPAR